jgi:tRNA pseudouridine38-40 synthase
MTRWRLTVEFDGGPFMGWQQLWTMAVGAKALGRHCPLTGELATVHAAGRTDAGVHALAMTAISMSEAPYRASAARGLHALVRPAGQRDQVTPVADDWHARFSALGRPHAILNRRAPRACKGVCMCMSRSMWTNGRGRAPVSRRLYTFRSIHCQSQSPVRR